MEAVEDHLFINNAGLVILPPFLPRYFESLDMLEDQQFKNEEMAARAVLLLQYVATGQSESPEYELVFNKILCGLSIEFSVPASIELSEQEIEMSSLLLTSVLQNWTMMKNSSIENFQGAFLLREGSLVKKKTTWSLHVEPKPYDIMLESLPWTTALVGLPWMKKSVTIEWRTQA